MSKPKKKKKIIPISVPFPTGWDGNLPLPDYLKLNIHDGVVFGNSGKEEIGEVFKTRIGDWILGFSPWIVYFYNLSSELLAICQVFNIVVYLHVIILFIK